MAYERTIENVEIDVDAARLRAEGKTYRQIAAIQGVTPGAAYQRVQRAIRDVPKEDAEEALRLELEKLSIIEQKFYEIAMKQHLKVSNTGKVVTLDGELITDDSPVMQALQGLLKVGERRAKLLGLNAPEKKEISGPDGRPLQIESVKEDILALLASFDG